MKPTKAAWLFVLPALLAIAVFFVVPVAAALVMSGTDFDIYALADLRNVRFIGLDNYVQLLETPLFWQALLNTLFFVVVGVPLSVAVSLVAALSLNSPLARFKGIYRTALFVPVLAHHLGYHVGEIPVNHRPRLNGRSRFGLERYLRGFFDLLTVTFMGRYRYRPLHLFGGIGLSLGIAGSGILLYLTAVKIGGASIGGRPLLLLGILLVVVGIQFFSLGLIGEMLTSNHQDKAGKPETPRPYVRDVLR